MIDLVSIGNKIRRSRVAGGLTQAELAKRAGVSRATISAIENGSIKEIGVYRLMEIVRCADGIQPRTELSQRGEKSRKSEALRLSFPYDWSNSSIKDEVLIDRVVERGIFEDLVRVYAAFGEAAVSERVQAFIKKNPAAGKTLSRMFNNISKVAKVA